jgi:hypothetical protein
MYRLIIDGATESAKGTFENFDDALYWYNYALQNNANSAALWCDLMLIKFFVRGDE